MATWPMQGSACRRVCRRRRTEPSNRAARGARADEGVALSTCHRADVSAVAERYHGAVQDIRNAFSELAFIPPEDFSDHLYSYFDDGAVNHLFSVAAGPDSRGLGA